MIETLIMEMVVHQVVEFNHSISVQVFHQFVLIMAQLFVVIEELKLAKHVMMEILLIEMDVMINVKFKLVFHYQLAFHYLVKFQRI